MNEHRLKHFQTRLIQTRETLLAGDEARRQASDTVHLDQQMVGRLSRMDAMQMQAMAKAEAARAGVLLKQIEAALGRIEQSRYGECAKCGEGIALARLEAAPATPFCQDCAV